MSHIHAPYHFVPLSKWVYMPDWAHQVSHDVPFKDGVSGKIKYTLTNKTPLLVGGEHVKEKGKPTLIKWARTPSKNDKEGDPVIPGSSLKGMIRNVLEIATFGKMSNVDDHHYSHRDISNAEARYQKELSESRAQAYWLKFDTSDNCWQLRKAKHTTLFHSEFNIFSKLKIKNEKHENGKKHKVPVHEKYQEWPLTNEVICFDIDKLKIKGTEGNDVHVDRAMNLGNGELKGQVVFASLRPGKKEYIEKRLGYSYVFFDIEALDKSVNIQTSQVNKLFDSHDESLVSYLKKNPHLEYGIPVFARLAKQSDDILALGFAKMPRKLYHQSVLETVQLTQNAVSADCFFDTAELMFGCLRDKGLSLKSRVMFTDAVCTKPQEVKVSDPVILGQPKASYLNAYLEQPKAENSILNVDHRRNVDLAQYDKGSVIAGWKRYPAQTAFKQHLPQDLASNVKTQSRLELMAPDSQFNGQIVFHNLKPQELGALLWTLQLGEAPNNEAYYHGLGHGKSLGAGAVQLQVSEPILIPNKPNSDVEIDKNGLINCFIEHMNKVYPAEQLSWQESPQVTHLLAFADRADNDGKDLTYMPLNDKDRNSTTVTYTSSVKGRQKQVLPPWRSNGKTLNRSEHINTSKRVIASFGQGRLNDLIVAERTQSPFIKHEFEKAEGLRAKTEQAKIEAKEQAVFDSLPAIEQSYVTLKNQLKPFAGVDEHKAKEARQSFNASLEALLDECIETDVGREFIGEFYQLCKDTKQSAFLDLAKNKKNKPKLQARKAKLAVLAKKYKLAE